MAQRLESLTTAQLGDPRTMTGSEASQPSAGRVQGTLGFGLLSVRPGHAAVPRILKAASPDFLLLSHLGTLRPRAEKPSGNLFKGPPCLMARSGSQIGQAAPLGEYTHDLCPTRPLDLVLSTGQSDGVLLCCPGQP
ncbi:uncharacterized protein LOC144253944 [Urocitellus parryii]